MAAPRNPIKLALAEDRLQLGCWLNFAHPTSAAICASAGFDWCLIDAEHGPNTLELIQAQLTAMQGHAAAPVVRVPWGEPWILKRVLDIGAQTIVVPMINTPEEAAAVVAACKYPPEGIRGKGAMLARATNWGQVSEYDATANDEICVIVQAETREALANLPEIAATPGVDCVFIGPADLSADMGYPSDKSPEVVTAVEEAVKVIRAAGKPAGIIYYDETLLPHLVDLGVRFLGVGADVSTFAPAIRELASSVRKTLS
ncbi:MAG: HpcH/HpaI aldolase family protein [Tropicimonas sp.]|uniref:HpcH/HpaI aldolase family protein n=1 Tax=Tropicimonas sp. TaxID=2067044 RepID=UPI003A8A8B43